jgi:hypothetical protein
VQPADLVTAALRTVDIAQLLVASGTIGSLRVGGVQLGQATVDRLVIRGITTSVHSGKASFESVRSIIRVEVIVDWWYNILFSSGSGRETFTSPLIPLEVGNLLVPSLQDIDVAVPEVTVENAHAQLAPVTNLDLGGARFDDVRANATKLPSDGFDVSGLEFGALTISEVGVPATATQSVSVARFRPNGNVTLPTLEVSGIEIPAAQAPRVVSSNPVNVFDLQPQDPYPVGGLDLGVFGFSIAVKPFVDLQIGVLTLDDVGLRASIDSLGVEGVTTPVTVQDIALGDVRLQQVTVNQITV